MKSRSLVFAGLALAFLVACKPAAIEYVKYESEETVPRISAADAKTEVDAGNAVLVDSRDAGSFNLERLPGAINIPAGASPDKFDQLPKGKKIIVYCS